MDNGILIGGSTAGQAKPSYGIEAWAVRIDLSVRRY